MKILVAGLGNLFLGDDGFGVEVVRRLGDRCGGAEVRDFGIRGQDLALALLDDWDAVVLVDAARRGGPPGTLYVIEPEAGAGGALSGHSMDPAQVLAAARALGSGVKCLRLVGCEPELVPGHYEDLMMGLSASVAASVDPACELVESLVRQLGAEVAHA